MANRKQKLTIRKLFFAFIPILVIAGVVTKISQPSSESGQTVSAISKACQNSPDCLAAVQAEAEANKNAANASSTATAYEAKVADLKVQIAQKNTEIAETEAQVDELQTEIVKTTAELTENREALAEILVNMHFESDSEPIYVLAGSESISDLAEKQAREEVAKDQISATAKKIKEAKEKLESDKSKVETLLKKQEEDKQELESTKAEQQSLVEKYQNDAAAYEEVAKAAQEAQRAAEKAEQEAHPELYRGTASSYTGANTYPWQADCPARQDLYLTYWDGHIIGGYACECVSYAGWKAYEAYGVVAAWGNASTWASGAQAAGYRVDRSPAAGTIGQTSSGYYGHVFWVESVNGDGSLNVTEYNNWWSTGLVSGNQHAGDFGARTISASEAAQYNYIHFN